MIHDPDLLERISELPCSEFSGQVYRATGANADPVAFSTSGGRWAPSDGSDGGFPILYTSTVREGALAEICSYLRLLTPIPQKPLRVHTLSVSTDRSLRVVLDKFGILGIDLTSFADRNYEVTQRIGAAINFLEFDGLIAPSARWQCDNVMIFERNHALDSKLQVITSEQIEFDKWHAVPIIERFSEVKT